MKQYITVTLRSANVARQNEWDKDAKITLSYRAMELAGEVGEACNIAKKIERERLGIQGSWATVQDLADELADIVICADLVALGEGIDLDSAVERKFNATSEKVGLETRLTLTRGTMVVHEIAAERRRQVEAKGWTPAHDDRHTAGELGQLGAALALYACNRSSVAQVIWPFDDYRPKLDNARGCLVKAAALIVAEIERLDRAASVEA